MASIFAAVPGWVPWVGAIVVAGAVGATLGVTGVVGHPTDDVTVTTVDARLSATATAYACPGGPEVTQLQRGDRVLAVSRSTDNAYFGVRDPLNLASTVWVTAADLAIDEGQADPASLPVGECPKVDAALIVPVQQAPLAPPPPSGSGSGADTTAPSLGGASSNTSPVCADSSPPAIISIPASDNVGVTGVSISWSGAESGSGSMSGSGATWTYAYNPVTTNFGDVNFTMTASDAAGDTAQRAFTLFQSQCVG